MLAALGGFTLRELLFGAAFGSADPQQDDSKRQRTDASGAELESAGAADELAAAADSGAASPAAGSQSTASDEQDAALLRAASADPEVQERAMVLAMRQSLWQAAQVTGQPAVVVTCEPEQLPCDQDTPFSAFQFTHCNTEEETMSALEAACVYYQTPSGVILFVLSLLLSRGCGGVKQDMDEPDTCLVQRFGHCSQELLNLAITGRATSGVFDGTKSLMEEMGGGNAELAGAPGLSMRGILQQPSLGYLTQLEALRYTSVGTHFKEPAWPIYVLASSSHYSLLFAMDHGVIQPSPSALARRAFDTCDASGGGMIQADDLQKVLRSAPLNTAYAGKLSQSPFHKVANDAAELQRVRTALDSGGIILWADFWRAVKPIFTEEAQALQLPTPPTSPTAGAAAAADNGTGVAVVVPPGGFSDKRQWAQAVFTACDSGGGQFLTEADATKAMKALRFNPPSTEASRADMWKAMNDLSDGMGIVFFDVFFSTVEGTLAEPPPPAPPAPSVPLVRSDSELARSLQQAEYGPTEGGAQSPTVPQAGVGSASSGDGGAGGGDFEVPALRDFTLYHFNGLTDASRAPRCVRLRVKQPDAGGSAAAEAEAFTQLGGVESALLHSMASAEGGLHGESGGGDAQALHKQRQKDLEALQSVLRTKWPGATVAACEQLVAVQGTADTLAGGEGGGTADPSSTAASQGAVHDDVLCRLQWLAASPPKID